MNSRSSLENHTRFQTKMDKVYIRFSSDQNGTKTLPVGRNRCPDIEGHPTSWFNLSPMRLYEKNVDSFTRANGNSACADCLALL